MVTMTGRAGVASGVALGDGVTTTGEIPTSDVAGEIPSTGVIGEIHTTGAVLTIILTLISIP